MIDINTNIMLDQWFSTFLSLQHTNFENEFGDTPKCKKDTKMMKTFQFLHIFFKF